MGNYDSCAYALPNMPPVCTEDKKLYPVSPFCKHSVCHRGKHVLWDGTESCKECPMYTDRAKCIHIRSGNFRAELFLDRLADLPLTKIRKIFMLMFSAASENGMAIATADACFTAAVTESKKVWEDAKAKNMYSTKKLQAKYERWLKILNYWNDTKHKMFY